MLSTKAMHKLPFFVSFIMLAVVIYFCIFQQSTQLTAVKRQLDLTRGMVVRTTPVQSNNLNQILNNSSSIMKEDSKLLNAFQNVSQVVYKMSQEYEKMKTDIAYQLQQLRDFHLNINVSLTHFPVFSDVLERLLRESRTYPSTSDRTIEKIRPKSLLTLFTTWPDSPGKYIIHNATLMNWATFKPVVNPVVFTDNPRILNQAKKFGWEGLRMTKVASNGMPVLKYMFMDAIKNFDSEFYGYANADILFTGNLVKTLTSLQYWDVIRTTKHMLISGVRTNLGGFSPEDIRWRSNIYTSAKEKGSLFITSSADYFIADKQYPWIDIPEVVIGVIAYDNWLIADARNHLYTTIDTTQTLLAVHLSQTGDQFESHLKTNASYNKDLLSNLFGQVNYFKGFTDCMQLFTELKNDTIVIQKRTQFAYYC